MRIAYRECPQRIAQAARPRWRLSTDHQLRGGDGEPRALFLRLLSEPELNQTLAVQRLSCKTTKQFEICPKLSTNCARAASLLNAFLRYPT